MTLPPVLTSWQRYRLPLKVSGPLPGRPAERGEFVTEVSFHGAGRSRCGTVPPP